MTRVALGVWRCECSILAKTPAEIPDLCPTHGEWLLSEPGVGRRSWHEWNDSMVMGIVEREAR